MGATACRRRSLTVIDARRLGAYCCLLFGAWISPSMGATRGGISLAATGPCGPLSGLRRRVTLAAIEPPPSKSRRTAPAMRYVCSTLETGRRSRDVPGA